MRIKLTSVLLIGMTMVVSVQAQDTAQLSQQLSPKYLEQIASKAGGLEQKMDKQTTKALQQWKKQENKILRKLVKTDSLKGVEIFGNAEEKYKQLEQKLQSKIPGKQYIGSLDTVSTSLKFLQQNPQFLAGAKGAKEKLSKAVSQVGRLENQFQKAEEVKKFLRERKQLLKEQLGNSGFVKEFKKLNKQTYYYSQRLSEYKSLVKDHKKAERRALEQLSKSKPFKDFMRKNSMLAYMFRLPDDASDPAAQASLAGLQTRTQVNDLIQQQIAAGGTNAKQQLSQTLQAAQSQISELKNKLGKFGSGNNDDEMPEGFKPNNEKTRSFLKRLELGTNIQSQRANGFFPVTSDIGVSLGYKLNTRSIVGIGSSYKVGLGQSIKHINITHQGIGLRSFADWKIKGSFWLSGAFEMNHRAEFQNIDELRNLNAWQQSGLIGLSKVVSLKTKFFKKTTLRLMWDFLSYQQAPRTQPVLLRVAYSIK